MKVKKFSIKYRFILLIALTIFTITGVVVGNIIPQSKAITAEAVQNNMRDIVSLSSQLIDAEVTANGKNNVGTPELTSILKNIGIKDVASSYIYVVDMSKAFVYHPRSEKIGTEVFNKTIADLVDHINRKESYDREKVFTYTDENGVKKYAAYCVSTVSDYVVVIVGDEKDALGKLNGMSSKSLFLILIIAVLLLLVSFFVSANIVKPIITMTNEIERTARLDFSDDGKLVAMTRSTAETGQMSKAIIDMQESLREMVQKLKVISSDMYANAENLTDVTAKINSASTENSATTEQLAAGMEETSATATVIDSNMEHIMENAENINQQATSGVNLAKAISERANDMNQNTISAYMATKEMYASVKEKTEDALEKSKAVQKVNELATGIQEIADQTSLLSLNASIEAARAGDHGRGFGIVAGEIGNLANQSTQTVTEIMNIVKEVNSAVASMEECMSTTLKFIETQVLKDYEMFEAVSQQYDKDATAVDQSMSSIYSMTEQMKVSAEDIVLAVSGISDTINEAAIGVSDVAEKTTDVVDLSTNVVSVVDNTAENSKHLEDIANSFIL